MGYMFGTVPSSKDSAVDNISKTLASVEPTLTEDFCKCPCERSRETLLVLQWYG